MNLAKAKILLDKINRLYKSMSLDEENVVAIEKDLMRDYVKQLYEAFLDEAPKSATTTRPKIGTPPPQPRETFTPPPPVQPKVEIKTPPPSPPPVREERVVRTAPSVVHTPPPPPKVEEKPVVKTTLPPPPPVVETTTAYTPYTPPPPKKVSARSGVNPEHVDLFDVNIDAKELSEKLGQSRILDLNNAMGLNEKIFTINELFGADNSFYRNVIRDLNAFASFDEAKAYLSANVAEKYNWTHKSKRNKAKQFIKLVRRRYL